MVNPGLPLDYNKFDWLLMGILHNLMMEDFHPSSQIVPSIKIKTNVRKMVGAITLLKRRLNHTKLLEGGG